MKKTILNNKLLEKINGRFPAQSQIKHVLFVDESVKVRIKSRRVGFRDHQVDANHNRKCLMSIL